MQVIMLIKCRSNIIDIGYYIYPAYEDILILPDTFSLYPMDKIPSSVDI